MVPPFSVWAPTGPGHCVIGCNTDYIPTRTPLDEPAVPRIDGTWGPHDYTTIPDYYDPEAPYLAWCPRESHPAQPSNAILDFTFTAQHYVKNPRAHTLGGLQKEIHRAFHGEVERMVQMYDEAAHNVKVHSPAVDPPEQALRYMRQAIVYLNLTDIYHRDCREGVETLRRNTREVLSFVLWARTLASNPSDVPFPVRGSIARDLSSYSYLSHHRVPAWLVVEHVGTFRQKPVAFRPLRDMCTLTTWREVHTQDVTCVDWEVCSPSLIKLKHTKPLWFYPPVVCHPMSFERAARGYADRHDKLNLDRDYQNHLNALLGKSYTSHAASSR